MSWEIVLGISALVGFFITCATPMIKLNTSITKLNETILTLKELVAKHDEENKQSHTRIYNRLDQHDSLIHSCSERISNIEGVSERRMEQVKNLEQETAIQGNKIAHMESDIDNIGKQVARNEAKIDQFHKHV